MAIARMPGWILTSRPADEPFGDVLRSDDDFNRLDLITHGDRPFLNHELVDAEGRHAADQQCAEEDASESFFVHLSNPR
jgi:hypothetical protein